MKDYSEATIKEIKSAITNHGELTEEGYDNWINDPEWQNETALQPLPHQPFRIPGIGHLVLDEGE